MFDAFPFDEWGESIADFWTFGGDGSTGTWIMNIIGFTVMWIAIIWFFVLEKRKLDAQASALRSTGAFTSHDPEPPSSVQ
jgi:hypothetical protein